MLALCSNDVRHDAHAAYTHTSITLSLECDVMPNKQIKCFFLLIFILPARWICEKLIWWQKRCYQHCAPCVRLLGGGKWIMHVGFRVCQVRAVNGLMDWPPLLSPSSPPHLPALPSMCLFLSAETGHSWFCLCCSSVVGWLLLYGDVFSSVMEYAWMHWSTAIFLSANPFTVLASLLSITPKLTFLKMWSVQAFCNLDVHVK